MCQTDLICDRNGSFHVENIFLSEPVIIFSFGLAASEKHLFNNKKYLKQFVFCPTWTSLHDRSNLLTVFATFHDHSGYIYCYINTLLVDSLLYINIHIYVWFNIMLMTHSYVFYVMSRNLTLMILR